MMRFRLLLVTLAASGLAACGNGAGSVVPQTSAVQTTASAARTTSDVIGGVGIDGFAIMARTTIASTATVRGSVTAGGVPQAGDSVALTNSYGNAIAVATTAVDGSFAFYGVRYGTYTLTVNGVATQTVSVKSSTVNLSAVAL